MPLPPLFCRCSQNGLSVVDLYQTYHPGSKECLFVCLFVCFQVANILQFFRISEETTCLHFLTVFFSSLFTGKSDPVQRQTSFIRIVQKSCEYKEGPHGEMPRSIPVYQLHCYYSQQTFTASGCTAM